MESELRDKNHKEKRIQRGKRLLSIAHLVVLQGNTFHQGQEYRVKTHTYPSQE